MRRPVRSRREKPWSSATRRYSPGPRFCRRYPPSASVTAVAPRGASGLDAVITTPGSTPPCASRTTPRMPPSALTCAWTGLAASNPSTTAMLHTPLTDIARSSKKRGGDCPPRMTRDHRAHARGSASREPRNALGCGRLTTLHMTQMSRDAGSETTASDCRSRSCIRVKSPQPHARPAAPSVSSPKGLPPMSARLSISAASLALVIAASPAIAQAPRPMTIVDLINVPRISDPQLAPDGKAILFVRSDADWKANKRVTHIWRAAPAPSRCSSPPAPMARAARAGRPTAPRSRSPRSGPAMRPRRSICCRWRAARPRG